MLANDINPVTITQVSSPLHGSFIHDGSGVFTYTQYAGFSGIDSYDYEVTDGSYTDTAKVILTIYPQSSSGVSLEIEWSAPDGSPRPFPPPHMATADVDNDGYLELAIIQNTVKFLQKLVIQVKNISYFLTAFWQTG